LYASASRNIPASSYEKALDLLKKSPRKGNLAVGGNFTAGGESDGDADKESILRTDRAASAGGKRKKRTGKGHGLRRGFLRGFWTPAGGLGRKAEVAKTAILGDHRSLRRRKIRKKITKRPLQRRRLTGQVRHELFHEEINCCRASGTQKVKKSMRDRKKKRRIMAAS